MEDAGEIKSESFVEKKNTYFRHCLQSNSTLNFEILENGCLIQTITNNII